MNRFLVASLFAALPATALAAASPWQEVAPDVRLRLISSDMLKPDGTTMVALEVQMPQGDKTYWKVPGESGIPTEIDTSASSGVDSPEIFWPLPQVEDADGVVDMVYRGPLVLPLSVGVGGGSASLSAKVSMGICSDVCMPVSAELALPLAFTTPDHSEGLRIAQAMADVPVAWDGDDQPIGDVTFDAASATLSVPVTDGAVDPASILVDPGLAGAFFGAPQKRPDAQVVTLQLLGNGADTVLVGRNVEVSFMTDAGPYSVTRRISTDGSTAEGR